METSKIETMKVAFPKNKGKAFILAAMVILTPLASFANTDAELLCEKQGGRLIDQRCDMSSPETFDIFGTTIVTILILGALVGLGASSSK